MKRRWSEEELIERWTLSPNELPLIANKTGSSSLLVLGVCEELRPSFVRGLYITWNAL